METNNQDLANKLNKLVEINNDRIEGYEKAMKETEDSDLKSLFTRFGSQSQKFHAELAREVSKLGEKPVSGTTTSGKFYRAWMDIKSALTGRDRKAILSSCEFGEDVAKDTYKSVMDDNELSSDLQGIVRKQYNELLSAHNEIKHLRDAVKVEN